MSKKIKNIQERQKIVKSPWKFQKGLEAHCKVIRQMAGRSLAFGRNTWRVNYNKLDKKLYMMSQMDGREFPIHWHLTIQKNILFLNAYFNFNQRVHREAS